MMMLKHPHLLLLLLLLLKPFLLYLDCQHMLNNGYSSNDKDLEALGSPLTAAADKPRRRWRSILVMLQAHQILISILGDLRNSLARLEISSDSSYAVLSTSEGDHHQVCFSFHRKYTLLKIPEALHILPHKIPLNY